MTRKLLFRKRLYVVKANIANKYINKINYKVLLVPRIKIKPRVRTVGNFLRKLLLKPVNLKINKNFKRYTDLRKDKIAKIRKKKKPKQLNKWLTKRMFRGVPRSILHPRKKRRFITRHNKLKFVNLFPKIRHIRKKISARKKRLIYKKYSPTIHWRQKWTFDRKSLRGFKHRRFSSVLEKITRRPLQINCENLFSYLVQKNVLTFKTHQNHFWNYRYRKYRFQYKNYYDILNSLFFISAVDNSQAFFLSILKITLPLIRKIRKFFRFLSMVIKYLPGIENKFAVFKMYIAGKLAGGTKRTKFHSIGYGVIPVQSLAVNAINSFLAYTHIYGEFGVKLIMCKHDRPNKQYNLLF